MKSPENNNWLDEALTKAIGSKETKPNFERWKQDHPEAVEMLTSRARRTSSVSRRPLNIRNIIMKSPITKIAVAAVVIIACAIGLSLWRTTGSGIALADVLARIEKVKAFRYKWILKIYGDEAPGKPVNVEIRAAVLELQEHGSKSSVEVLDPNGGESTFTEVYVLPQRKTMIRITPKQKKYERQELDDAMLDRLQKRNNNMDPCALVKKILKCKYESTGRATIDGIEAEGFRTTDPNYKSGGGFKNLQVDVKMWVDLKTRLPVRYEEITSAGMSQQFVMYDYQWDVPVDASEFEPVIPDGYTVVTAPKKPAPTEENAIKGLKLYADLSGHYPKKANWTPEYQWSVFEKSETPAALRLKEETKGLTEDDKSNRLRDALLPLHGIGIFYARLTRDAKDPAYYGETVTPKDTDKILLRWKVSDNEYRVIFGDLHAETVTAEKLTELEKLISK